jgi:hypothetical protein
MNEYMKERMGGWMGGWMDGLMKEQRNEWVAAMNGHKYHFLFYFPLLCFLRKASLYSCTTPAVKCSVSGIVGEAM